MKSAFKPVWGILAIVVAMIAIVTVSRRLEPKEVIPWRGDWESASAEARRTGKPVFAYFTAEWCGPCQQLKSTTWADANVEAALQYYVPVRVDVDQQPELARRYVPTPQNMDGGIPAFRVLDEKGQIVKEAVGAMPPEQFLEWLGRR
jgi:thiol:disulfide interchange protein